MCEYCGCRSFPLIARLTEEHEEIANAAGRLRRAVTHSEADPITALDELLALLRPHTGVEETGLFVELRAEGSLAEEVDKLCAEHDDIHGVLGAVDRTTPDWPAVLAALDRLHRHIDNEEHGLFPASIIALPIDAWDRVTPERAHSDTHSYQSGEHHRHHPIAHTA
jgi:hemerythrin-like domain-containing protein